jgi:chloramphenicol-sensitive protein RarD
MSEIGKGMVAMVAACTIWGLSPLYWDLVSHVPPLEVLAHRTLWSLVFFGIVLAVQGRISQVTRLIAQPREVWKVLLAALMISANWFLFIYSVQIDRVVEASLGYYIFPLVAVLFGMVVFGERLGRVRGLAVGLAAVAVAVLTLGLGVAPWISLALAATFGAYGLIKKGLAAGPVVSVTAEVALLAPLAIVWLAGVHLFGWTGVTGTAYGAFGRDLQASLVLVTAGVLTATPLILFSYGARRLPMGTTGLLQYINPSLQFLIAAVIFGEPITRWHWIAVPLIWVAVAIFSVESLRQDRAARRRSISASTSGTTVM